MGKYSDYAQLGKDIDGTEHDVLNVKKSMLLRAIANELAEANRLKRIALVIKKGEAKSAYSAEDLLMLNSSNEDQA